MGLGVFLLINFVFIFVVMYIAQKTRFKPIDGYNKLKLAEDIPYYRDIPNISIEEAYFLGYLYGLVQNPSDLIGAMLLKWVKEEKIFLKRDGDKVVVDMNKAVKFTNRYESKIYFKLLASSGSNFILEEAEFINFFKSKAIVKLLRNMLVETERYFIVNGLFRKDAFGAEYKYYLDDGLKEKAYQMAGLKKFLLDFSNIDIKSSQEVVLWEDYLIYAQLMGIADKVEEQFAKLYPNYNHFIEYSIIRSALLVSLANSLRFLPFLFISR